MNFRNTERQLAEKRIELEDLKQDYAELQEVSKAIEAELEGELQQVKTELSHIKNENFDLKEKIKELNITFADRVKELEKNISRLTKEKECLETKLEGVTKLAKNYEIDLDKFRDTLREKEFEIEQVTSFYHQTLEDLAITCNELESIKDLSMESIQKIKNQITDLNLEVEIARRKSRSFSTASSLNAFQPQRASVVISRGSAVGLVDNLLTELQSRLKSVHLT
ncbi:hypothetical protein SteCoe_12126 [Stentor coeruleus]|uniref:NUDE domain-containing protein n=1 Tax=Stentor coeruleus TaxID=5963 RepID=A0A1R2CBM3_9CILI|nr:hypothetical protein SteCoe_12126 [Stentor coeruleus]